MREVCIEFVADNPPKKFRDLNFHVTYTSSNQKTILTTFLIMLRTPKTLEKLKKKYFSKGDFPLKIKIDLKNLSKSSADVEQALVKELTKIDLKHVGPFFEKTAFEVNLAKILTHESGSTELKSDAKLITIEAKKDPDAIPQLEDWTLTINPKPFYVEGQKINDGTLKKDNKDFKVHVLDYTSDSDNAFQLKLTSHTLVRKYLKDYYLPIYGYQRKTQVNTKHQALITHSGVSLNDICEILAASNRLLPSRTRLRIIHDIVKAFSGFKSFNDREKDKVLLLYRDINISNLILADDWAAQSKKTFDAQELATLKPFCYLGLANKDRQTFSQGTVLRQIGFTIAEIWCHQEWDDATPLDKAQIILRDIHSNKKLRENWGLWYKSPKDGGPSPLLLHLTQLLSCAVNPNFQPSMEVIAGLIQWDFKNLQEKKEVDDSDLLKIVFGMQLPVGPELSTEQRFALYQKFFKETSLTLQQFENHLLTGFNFDQLWHLKDKSLAATTVNTLSAPTLKPVEPPKPITSHKNKTTETKGVPTHTDSQNKFKYQAIDSSTVQLGEGIEVGTAGEYEVYKGTWTPPSGETLNVDIIAFFENASMSYELLRDSCARAINGFGKYGVPIYGYCPDKRYIILKSMRSTVEQLLNDARARGKPLDRLTILRICYDVARGLARLGSEINLKELEGNSSRDVKSTNVKVDDTFQSRLAMSPDDLDDPEFLAFAQLAHDGYGGTRSKSMKSGTKGDLYHLPPDSKAENTDYDEKVIVWRLGVLLFEMWLQIPWDRYTEADRERAVIKRLKPKENKEVSDTYTYKWMAQPDIGGAPAIFYEVVQVGCWQLDSKKRPSARVVSNVMKWALMDQLAIDYVKEYFKKYPEAKKSLQIQTNDSDIVKARKKKYDRLLASIDNLKDPDQIGALSIDAEEIIHVLGFKLFPVHSGSTSNLVMLKPAAENSFNNNLFGDNQHQLGLNQIQPKFPSFTTNIPAVNNQPKPATHQSQLKFPGYTVNNLPAHMFNNPQSVYPAPIYSAWPYTQPSYPVYTPSKPTTFHVPYAQKQESPLSNFDSSIKNNPSFPSTPATSTVHSPKILEIVIDPKPETPAKLVSVPHTFEHKTQPASDPKSEAIPKSVTPTPPPLENKAPAVSVSKLETAPQPADATPPPSEDKPSITATAAKKHFTEKELKENALKMDKLYLAALHERPILKDLDKLKERYDIIVNECQKNNRSLPWKNFETFKKHKEAEYETKLIAQCEAFQRLKCQPNILHENSLEQRYNDIILEYKRECYNAHRQNKPLPAPPPEKSAFKEKALEEFPKELKEFRRIQESEYAVNILWAQTYPELQAIVNFPNTKLDNSQEADHQPLVDVKAPSPTLSSHTTISAPSTPAKEFQVTPSIPRPQESKDEPQPMTSTFESVEIKTVVDVKTVKLGNMIREGSYGAVYDGFYDQVPVAIKLSAAALNPAKIKAFKTENEPLIKLFENHHPALVAIYGISIINKKAAIIMERLSTSLDLWFTDHPFSEDQFEQRLKYAFSISSAIEHLHKNKLAHGNLHTGNVLLNERDPVAKVSYYRTQALREVSASCSDRPTNLTAFAHTSPEFRSTNPTLEGDIYSFGIILYQLAFGKLPFNSQNIGDLLKEIRKGITEKMPAELSEIQKLFKDLILQCCDINPKERPCIAHIRVELKNISKKFNRHRVRKAPHKTEEKLPEVKPEDFSPQAIDTVHLYQIQTPIEEKSEGLHPASTKDIEWVDAMLALHPLTHFERTTVEVFNYPNVANTFSHAAYLNQVRAKNKVLTQALPTDKMNLVHKFEGHVSKIKSAQGVKFFPGWLNTIISHKDREKDTFNTFDKFIKINETRTNDKMGNGIYFIQNLNSLLKTNAADGFLYAVLGYCQYTNVWPLKLPGESVARKNNPSGFDAYCSIDPETNSRTLTVFEPVMVYGQMLVKFQPKMKLVPQIDLKYEQTNHQRIKF